MCPWFESRWYHKNKRTIQSACFVSAHPTAMYPEALDLQLHDILNWIDETRPTRLAVVMDRNTEKHCLPLLSPLLPPHTEFLCLTPPGERIKSIEHALALWSQLDEAGFDRSSAILGLGGGTITDLTGFVASTYLRGISCWLAPTTLLGMVDAAIGGKTGINLANGKNRIGTFQQPVGVSINPLFLNTLPERHRNNGWAEHAKHLLLAVENCNLGATLAPLMKEDADAESVGAAILQSVRIKSNIVETDETERNGKRQQLNFGHTVGHALESWAMTEDQDLLHGEAVAWGMQIELKISALLCAENDEDKTQLLAASADLNTRFPSQLMLPSAETLWEWMRKDKKNKAEKVHMALLTRPGHPSMNVEVSLTSFKDALV